MSVQSAETAGDGSGAPADYRDLVRLLGDGLIVPFLGAGVSREARSVKHVDLEPTVEWLVNQLQRLYLSSRLEGQPAQIKEEKLGELCERFRWTCGLSHQAIVRALRIVDFSGLEPRPAHRYLAWLAREGLIEEIITTNYDTCLEQAFHSSFGPAYASGLGRGWPCYAGDKPWSTITTVEAYQASGGARRTVNGLRRPRLRIYKINGCAQEIAECQVSGATCGKKCPDLQPPLIGACPMDRIALTERQLQDWRQNHWARELFKDRARSHRLLFVGFGSDEPQIRHTALALLEEEMDGRRAAAGVSDPSEPPKAFLSQHCCDLTFNQEQIMRGFDQRRVPSSPLSGTTLPRGVFTGRHSAFFRVRSDARWSNPGKLSADALFRRVYFDVLNGLIGRYSRSGFPFYGWLKSLGLRDAARLSALPGQWLFPRCTDKVVGVETPSPDLSRAARLLAFPGIDSQDLQAEGWPQAYLGECYGSGPPRLHRWIWSLRQAGVHSVRDYYAPLREDSLLVLSLLLLLALLHPYRPSASWLPRARPTDHAGLLLRGVLHRSLHDLVYYRTDITVALATAALPRASLGWEEARLLRRSRRLVQVILPQLWRTGVRAGRADHLEERHVMLVRVPEQCQASMTGIMGRERVRIVRVQRVPASVVVGASSAEHRGEERGWQLESGALRLALARQRRSPRARMVAVRSASISVR